MSTLASQLQTQLPTMSGLQACQFNGTDTDGNVLTIDFQQVESFGSSIYEIRMTVPRLQNAGTAPLQAWAQAMSARINYLMEPIGILEVDPQTGAILARSTPPAQKSGATTFFEVLLKSLGAGTFSLCRYEATQGSSGRIQVPLSLTHEALVRLVTDLVDCIP